MFKIFDFGLHDRQNGSRMALGDNAILAEETGYSGSNDAGEWKPLYASASKEAMAAALAREGYKMVLVDPVDPVEPEPEPEPDPEPDADVTPDTFRAALAPGVTLRLAPGDYGELLSIPDGVTLTANRDAIFRRVDLSGAKRITFRRVVFSPQFDTDKPDAKRNRFEGCEDILIEDGLISPERADGVIATGRGMNFIGCRRVRVAENDISGWHKCVQFSDTVEFALEENKIWDMASDGITVGRNSRHGKIRKNRIGIRTAIAGHGDMCVFQRKGDTTIVDVLIEENIFDLGTGLAGQTLYADGGDGITYHKEIVVRGNLIFASHRNTIFFNYMDSPVIEDNTLIRMDRRSDDEPGHGYDITRVVVNGKNCPNAIVQGNISMGYSNDFDLPGNQVLLPEQYPEYFDKLEKGDDWTVFIPKPGAFDGIGSPLLHGVG